MKLFTANDDEITRLRESNMTVIGNALDNMVSPYGSTEERQQVAESIKRLLQAYSKLEISNSELAYVSGMLAGVLTMGALVIGTLLLKYLIIPMFI